MIFNITTGGRKYFVKDGVQYVNIALAYAASLHQEDGWLVVSNGNVGSGVNNWIDFGINKINLTPYTKIVLVVGDCNTEHGVSGRDVARFEVRDTIVGSSWYDIMTECDVYANSTAELNVADLNGTYTIQIGCVPSGGYTPYFKIKDFYIE